MLGLLRWLIEVVFWMITGTVLLLILSLVLAPITWWFAPAAALLLLVLVSRSIYDARQRRAMAVLSYLEQAVRLNLPLPPMLDAAAQSERGGTRRRLERLNIAIRRGDDLGFALDEQLPELPLDSVSLVAAGERLGRLPVALRRAADKQRALMEGRTGQRDQRIAWTYAVTVLSVTLAMIGGLMLLIVPQFEAIFEDFDTALPWTTLVTMQVSRDYASVFLLVGILIILCLVAYSTASALHPAFGRWRTVRPILDHLLYPLPVLGTAARDASLADACGLIADGLRSGATMATVLAEAGELNVNAVVRRRLGNFAAEVAGGRSLQDAAKRTRLPRLMRGMLGSVDRGADAVGTFRFLAQYYDNRASRLLEAFRAASMPIAVLVLALLIGWIVIGMFQPLVTLIWATVEGTELY